jgi:UDP-N-acetylglucosamine diphosphorylase / glucose-1-phosphate thymidylyltransferase / UDP-N-acetylgalactosamine diphosphorylase / glucosamine-1-phosphate N-acetyltransferase / galactosamine-1-phosphate N-acetyltransferase
MQVCIFEDSHSVNFLPLVYFRPVYELRCGIFSLREKIQRTRKSLKPIFQVRPDLAAYLREEFPAYHVNTFPDDDYWCVNGRVLFDGTLRKLIRTPLKNDCVFYYGEEVVAAYLTRHRANEVLPSFQNKIFDVKNIGAIPTQQIQATLLEYPWDVIQHTPEEIINDFHIINKTKKINGKIFPGVSLINRQNIIIGNGSIIKPGVVLDAEHGPIVIGRNVTIMPNAVIEGPAYIGDHAIVKIGAKIYHGTSIGIHCKVGGEIENSVIHSYANKQHEGFLGHSYLGSWVNLGADTNTSDLKNNYSNVRVIVNGVSVDTGMQFMGLTMGDHSKSGINVMFDTGTNIGVSCNIYGADLPPKYLPSFSWGGGTQYTTYDVEKSIETMRRVMKRREVVMSSVYEQIVRSIFASSKIERKESGVN